MTEATQSVTFAGRSYALDEHGFLFPPKQWDETFAEGMAGMQGISGGLTEEHWRFVRYLRRKFLEEHDVPLLVHACAENGLRLGRMKALFPAGYHRGACRIAGIGYEFMYRLNIWHTYETKPVLSARYPIDALGFLRDFDRWDEGFPAAGIARGDPVAALGERHWQVIRFLRAYYRDHRVVPTVYATCEANGLDLEELGRLFPGGYRRGACRLAGLPFFG